MFWKVPPADWLNLLPRQALATHMEKHDKTLRQIGRPALYFRFKKLDPSWNSNTPIDMSPNAGQKNGLSIIVDMKPSEKDIPSSISNDFNGVEVNVGPRHTFPRLGIERE